MRYKLLYHIIALFTLCFAFESKAGEGDLMRSSKGFNKQEWEKIVEGMDYTETFPEREFDNNKKNQPQAYREPASLNLGFLRYPLFIGIIIILVYFLYRFIAGNKSLQQIKQKNKIDLLNNLEENIHKADLPDLLNEAIKNKAYNQAIRIQFLIIIKQLSVQKLIHWKKDKTNGEYIREMRKNALYKDFRLLSLLYDKIWYGEYNLNTDEFFTLRKEYDTFLTKIVPHE